MIWPADGNALPNPKPSSHFSSLSLSLPFMLFSSTMASSAVVYAIDPLVSFLQSDALKTLGPADFDPKLYVGLPLKNDFSVTEAAFTRLPRVKGAIPEAGLERFVEEYFDEAGSDLVYTEPVDFVAEPEGFLPKVENPKVRAWALEVHALWRNLSRRVADEVRRRPERHTLLPLPEMLIIPGSRFREVYY